jgi:drug/metabolite transporter (DMT)-like permease
VLFPVIALILSTFFEDLRWGIPQLLGVVLILLGNAVVVTKKSGFNFRKIFSGDSVTN